MENIRLTWNEIKEKYPHQNVGLIDVEYIGKGLGIKSAVVLCTDKSTSYDEMCLMAVRGNIDMRYTTLDEDLQITGIPDIEISVKDIIRRYVEDKLAKCLVENTNIVDKDYAAAISYAILFEVVKDVIAPSVVSGDVADISAEEFMEAFGVKKTMIVGQDEYEETLYMFCKAKILVPVVNFRMRTERHLYLTDTAIAYQLFIFFFTGSKLPQAIYEYLYKSKYVVELSNNLYTDKNFKDELYYVKGKADEEVFLVVGEPRYHCAFLFDFVFGNKVELYNKDLLVNNKIENMLSDTDIRGRYVMYMGANTVKSIRNKEILYINNEDMLATYYFFSLHKRTIEREMADAACENEQDFQEMLIK